MQPFSLLTHNLGAQSGVSTFLFLEYKYTTFCRSQSAPEDLVSATDTGPDLFIIRFRVAEVIELGLYNEP